MNRKKLPRVITASDGATRDALASGVADVPAARPAKSESVGARDDMVQNAVAAHKLAVVKPLPEPSSGSQGTSAQRVQPAAGVNVARRRARALKIVDRHAGYSAIGGVIPLAIANYAGVTAAIVRMVKVLSDHYGVPFERDRARAIVVGLVAGAMPSGLAAVTSSTLVHVIPGGTFVSLAVSSLSAAACTRGIGRVFVEHFENGATLVDFPTTHRLQAR